MTTALHRILDGLKRLHRCERGAEGLEKILIFAAIVLPLLGLLLIFKDRLSEWLGGEWTEVRDDSDIYDPNDYIN